MVDYIYDFKLYKMRNIYPLLFLLVANLCANAQHKKSSDLHLMVMKKTDPIICYARPEAMHTKVPIPSYLKDKLQNPNAKIAATANIEVTYVGFTPQAQTAFQYAVDIWSNLVTSDVPIKIYAEYKELDPGVLGSTIWGTLFANFKNAQRNNVWYPVAMAEKIAGEELNEPEDYEIYMSFSNAIDWYQGTDQNTPTGKYDMVSVVLHEIAHGLGYTSNTFVEDSGTGTYTIVGGTNPIIFDTSLENGSGENLIMEYQNNTTAFGGQITGEDLFFNSFSFGGSSLPQLYAPSSWDSGSSVAHLDETKYPAGNANSLMTPQLGTAESIHDPGLSLLMLDDMGWTSMNIMHDRLTDTEDLFNPYPVVATIKGDNAIGGNAVVLHYSFDQWVSDNTVAMSATGNPNEYKAEIPPTGESLIVNYYISVVDSETRNYSSPGEAPDFSHVFTVAPDTIPPLIDHTPLPVVFMHDLHAQIVAKVTDNIGAGDLTLTYKINGGAEDSFIVPLAAVSTDGSYTGVYDYDWDLTSFGLQKGDIIEYKLDVEDVAFTPHLITHPGVGFNAIVVDELNPVVIQYSNNFNSATNDFIGSGFTIETTSGFASGAIQSDHPYRTTDGESPSDTLILSYLLKTPIKLNEKGAILDFDEVVLVEPGENGTSYGDDQFWDYVIVEGSDDYGITWKPFLDGYDCREYSDWEDTYNGSLVANADNTSQNSAASGDETLFKHRTVDLLQNGLFTAGDTVLIRFKLYADQLAVGWGWAIDNLKVQIDNTPPEIEHIAPDYLQIGQTQVVLNAKVTDNVEVSKVRFDVNVDGNLTSSEFPGPDGTFQLNVNFASPVTSNTVFQYSITAEDIDANKNTASLPETGSFSIPVAILGSPLNQYVNDFNSVSNDFIGTNFVIDQEPGFTDAAINSPHPYPDAPFESATLSYLLKTPIILNNDQAWVRYDEVTLVDNLSDYVTLQGSTDGGATWVDIVEPYNASRDGTLWLGPYITGSNGINSTTVADKTFIKSYLFDILSNDAFHANDEVLFRFTMNVDDSRHGWGWLIDNLEIQGPTTGVENNLFSALSIYPNPVHSSLLIKGRAVSSSNDLTIRIVDQLGRSIKFTGVSNEYNGIIDTSIDMTGVEKGLYILQITDGVRSTSERIMVE